MPMRARRRAAYPAARWAGGRRGRFRACVSSFKHLFAIVHDANGEPGMVSNASGARLRATGNLAATTLNDARENLVRAALATSSPPGPGVRRLRPRARDAGRVCPSGGIEL